MENRHKDISLRLTTALATAILLSACGQSDNGWTAQRDTAICVDGSGNRVPDDDCAPRTAHAGGSPFLWYYLGRSSSIPPYGDRAAGGSFTRTSGATYFHAPIETAVTRSVAVARGGLVNPRMPSAGSASEASGDPAAFRLEIARRGPRPRLAYQRRSALLE